MTRIFLILKRIILILTGIGLIGAIVFYIWLIDRWKDKRSEEDLIEFVEQINSYQDYPERFYEIFAKVYNYNQETSTFWTLLKLPWNRFIIQDPTTTCPCMEVNYGFVVNGFDRWSVGLELEKHTIPKNCLNAYLASFRFPHSGDGIRNASKFYFKKDIYNLSDDELLSLVIMTKGPTSFNPLYNSENLKKELQKYK